MHILGTDRSRGELNLLRKNLFCIFLYHGRSKHLYFSKQEYNENNRVCMLSMQLCCWFLSPEAS